MTQEKWRVGLIGYGFILSKGHVPAYLKRPDIEVVALADICESRRWLAQESLPNVRFYTDAEILIEQEKDNLDFIDIATPPCDHFSIARKALENGLHVLCEKPITVSADEAHQLMLLAQEKKRVFFPCHNYKHAPVVKSIQSIIESGEIGGVKSVTLSTYRNTHAKGVTEWRTHWRRDHKTSGGGIAMDHGSHTLYLTFDWLKSYPTHVTAHMANLSNGEYDTEDNFSAVLTFPTGIAHVHLTWTAGIRKVIYTLQGENGGIVVDDDDLQIHKQVKTAGPDVAQGNVTWNRKNESISSNWMDASHVSWFNSLLDQFFSAIKNGEHIGKEAKDAFKCIQTIEACYHSAKNGSIQTIVPNSDLK